MNRTSELEWLEGANGMGEAKAPRSLRSIATINSVDEKLDNNLERKVSAVAGLIAVASFSGAEAQQQTSRR